MTSFGSVLKQMTVKRIKLMNQIILVQISVIIGSCLYDFFKGNMGSNDKTLANVTAIEMGSLIALGIVSIVYLISFMNLEVNSNRFRLIPISDIKLYMGSFLSTVFGFMYICLIDLIILGSSVLIIADKKMISRMFSDIHFNEIIMMLLALFLIFSIFIFGMIMCNTINILGSVITSFIPGGKQKIVKWIVYAIAIFLIYKVSSYVDIAGWLPGVDWTGDINDLSYSIMQVIIEIIIFVVINMNLLRFVETSK
ncbi:hypothetical protein RD055328_06950 [Companilactobacillus sp. RD055328]|uniref:hypothetical protein n=1 Tax=Companilactobacillus sp. RD055328 TaxID=2916634 RepID=UPI001FC84681|nr:hypothetical protein [Companilactobacillus sp. RD055328]GKQ42772.1 hypothetical protein RD055328_06950 [Companilactobacillus sp. RD055328]